MQALAGALRTNQSLQVLWFQSNNGLRRAGREALCGALRARMASGCGTPLRIMAPEYDIHHQEVEDPRPLGPEYEDPVCWE